MRYSLHEIDTHDVVATTVAPNREEALEWFSEKLRLMLTFEGDPSSADYLLDEWAESLPYLAHTSKPTIPVFVVRATAARAQAAQGDAVRSRLRCLENSFASLSQIRRRP